MIIILLVLPKEASCSLTDPRIPFLYCNYPPIPRAAEISASAAFSGSLTATPFSFAASATFRPIARTHFLYARPSSGGTFARLVAADLQASRVFVRYPA